MMKKTAPIIQLTEKTQIDQDGQVMFHEETRTTRLPAEDNFVKLYLGSILHIQNLPIGLNTTLYELLKYMNYNNEIVVNSTIKKRIAEKTGMQVNSITNSISRLKKGKILFSKERGVYTVNPFIFGKGDWKDIHNLRLEIDFDPDATEFKTTITRKEESNKIKQA